MKYEFIKHGKNYIVKNSGGRIVSEEEKLKMEKKELILKDITGKDCQKETTKQISKINKRLKEIKDDANDIIQETTTTISRHNK